MSMNMPQEQPQQPMEQAAAPMPDETMAAPEMTADTGAAPAGDEQQQAAQDQKVVEQVAQGLADDEITATDIMTAVLSDSLGISPNAALSLFQLLMSELAEDVQEQQVAAAPEEQAAATPTVEPTAAHTTEELPPQGTV